MQFYEAPLLEEKKPDAETMCPGPPKVEEILPKTAARPESGGFRLTVFQFMLCLLILLAALFLRSFLPELYGELRARYDAELSKSVLITQDDIPSA